MSGTDHTIVFDLETGGVELHHPVIQVAAIAVRGPDWNEVAAFEQKIAFDPAACNPEALRINHYEASAWSMAVAPAVAAAKFAAFVRPYSSVAMTSKAGKAYSVAKLAGYNAVAFDAPRLKALFGDRFFPCAFLVRDVLQRVVWHYDERGPAPVNFKLSTVAQALGVATDGAHDALADVRMTAAVYRAVRGGAA